MKLFKFKNMSYSQFIMAVFAIYVVYYAANILYDAFLKARQNQYSEEEEIISIGEGRRNTSQSCR